MLNPGHRLWMFCFVHGMQENTGYNDRARQGTHTRIHIKKERETHVSATESRGQKMLFGRWVLVLVVVQQYRM